MVEDWIAADWAAAARTVELEVALAGNRSAALVIGTLVLTSGLTAGTAPTRVELVVPVVSFESSVASFGGLDVVVFAVSGVGNVVGLCVEVGESTTGRAVVVAGAVGTGCVTGTVVLGAKTVDEAVDASVAAVDVVVEEVVDVEVRGSGHGIATVTASATSVPLPSETMHCRLLAGVVASAFAVTVKSAVSPRFTRAIAGSNTKLTPSQVPSCGRIATGAERIAAASDSELEVVVESALMVEAVSFMAAVVAAVFVVVLVAAEVVELTARTFAVDVGVSEAPAPDVVVSATTGVAATGAPGPLWESAGKTLTLCPRVAAANADSAPASP
jgi:hypothetical protein